MEKYDILSIERIKTAHPALRKELEVIYHEANNKLAKSRLRFACVLRPFEEQNRLFAIGRTVRGKKVTNAKAGESNHNYGLAVDIVLLIDKDGNGTFESATWDTNADFDSDGVSDWLEVVKVFQKYGWTWGFWKNGRHWDKPHFQKTYGLHWKTLLKRKQAGEVDCEGYVKL